MISTAPFPELVARLPLTGFALQNGTPSILTATAPNDGRLHPVGIQGIQIVTVAQTGGQIIVAGTAGGSGYGLQIAPGGLGAGQYQCSGQYMADPGTTVSILQNSALTLGNGTLFAAIAIL